MIENIIFEQIAATLLENQDALLAPSAGEEFLNHLYNLDGQALSSDHTMYVAEATEVADAGSESSEPEGGEAESSGEGNKDEWDELFEDEEFRKALEEDGYDPDGLAEELREIYG